MWWGGWVDWLKILRIALNDSSFDRWPRPSIILFLSISDVNQWGQSGGGFADFIVGKDKKTDSDIKSPYGVAARNGKIYVCDLSQDVQNIHVIDVPNEKYYLLGKRGQLVKPVNDTRHESPSRIASVRKVTGDGPWIAPTPPYGTPESRS